MHVTAEKNDQTSNSRIPVSRLVTRFWVVIWRYSLACEFSDRYLETSSESYPVAWSGRNSDLFAVSFQVNQILKPKLSQVPRFKRPGRFQQCEVALRKLLCLSVCKVDDFSWRCHMNIWIKLLPHRNDPFQLRSVPYNGTSFIIYL